MQKNKYNLNLEVLRGIAAILVVFGHLGLLTFSFFSGTDNYSFRLINAWATPAVIIFFVLSGIVIHSSFDQMPRSNAGFLVNRIIRIHPILIVIIAFTILVEKFIRYNPITIQQVIGNIIPVSTFNGVIAKLFSSNTVIWSLSYEMFFYVVFAIAGIYKATLNKNSLIIWFVLSIIAIPGYYYISSVPIINYLLLMLPFSGIWLIGFFIWHLQKVYRSNIFSAIFSLSCLPLISRLHITANYYDPIKFLFFAIASIPFFIYLCQLGQQTNTTTKSYRVLLGVTVICFLFSAILIAMDDSYTNGIKCVYIFLPISAVFILNRYFKMAVKFLYYRIIVRPFSYIGKISYAVYLVHSPIFIAINCLQVSIVFKLLFCIVTIFPASIFLERWFQPFIKKQYKRLLPGLNN